MPAVLKVRSAVSGVKRKRYGMMVAILAKAAVWEGCCVVQMNNEDEQPCVLLAMDGGSVHALFFESGCVMEANGSVGFSQTVLFFT